MCIDAKEAKKIADNAVLNQNAIVINDIANRVFSAAKEGRYRENFEFSYPLPFRWEIIKDYLTEREDIKLVQISVMILSVFQLCGTSEGLDNDSK